MIKKAISPVVATALLLVVAVVTVVGFQGWFQTFSSNLFVDIEQQGSVSNFNVGIEALVGNNLYFRSAEGTQINSVTIDGFDCSGLNGTYSSGIQLLDVSGCLSSVTSATPNIVVVTDSGILSRMVFISGNNPVSSLDCSALPGDWIEVPGNSYFGTSNFCVMKYEAKAFNTVTNIVESRASNTITGYLPFSSANQTPWVSINLTQAINACENLGEDYKLITNREWMTIARNIENNSNNWNSGIVGDGGIFRGNINLPDEISCGSNSVLDGDTDGNNCLITNAIYTNRNKRLLQLSNGEEIWDLSGNVWQWVDLMENGSTLETGNVCNGSGWFSFYENDGHNECTWQNNFNKTGSFNRIFEIGPINNFNSLFGVGKILSSTNNEIAVLRGGAWFFGVFSGIYSTLLGNEPSITTGSIGFRCTYTP